MDPEKSPEPRFSTRLIVGAILGVTALIALAFFVGRASAPYERMPGTTSAEAGFARDMQTHHLQAVEMSMLVRDRSDNPEVELLAYDIATSQQQQAGQMFGWLNVWGVPQAAPEPSMTWMTRPALDGEAHGHGDGAHVPGDAMPGLASRAQIAKLGSLTGLDSERYYLELMIAHHQGGVYMAQALLDRSDHRVVSALARGIVTVQQSEIEYMQDLLRKRS